MKRNALVFGQELLPGPRGLPEQLPAEFVGWRLPVAGRRLVAGRRPLAGVAAVVQLVKFVDTWPSDPYSAQLAVVVVVVVVVVAAAVLPVVGPFAVVRTVCTMP